MLVVAVSEGRPAQHLVGHLVDFTNENYPVIHTVGTISAQEHLHNKVDANFVFLKIFYKKSYTL